MRACLQVVNPDRQFQQGGDLNRYGDVMEYMLKGNKGGMPLRDEESSDSAAAQMLGCVPSRERRCSEKIARAARQGSWITVENCHRWQAAHSLALSDGFEDGMSGLPDVGMDWRQICEVPARRIIHAAMFLVSRRISRLSSTPAIDKMSLANLSYPAGLLLEKSADVCGGHAGPAAAPGVPRAAR
jgi:hypothetical protein